MKLKRILISVILGCLFMTTGMYVHYSNEPSPMVIDYTYINSKSVSAKITETYPIMTDKILFSEILPTVTSLSYRSTRLESLFPDFSLHLNEESSEFFTIFELLNDYSLEPIDYNYFTDGGGTYYIDGKFNPSMTFYSVDIQENNGNYIVPEVIFFDFNLKEPSDNMIVNIEIMQNGFVLVKYLDSTVSSGVQSVPYILSDDGHALMEKMDLLILRSEELFP